MSGQRPVGVVLTGGASKRMGTDKATLVVGGKPMAVRVADAMWEAGCHPVEAQGGDVDAIEQYGLEAIPDRAPGEGPVVAILDAALRHARSDVVVAACDLVDLDAPTIRSLIQCGASGGSADVVVAATGSERHLVSWWRAGSARRLQTLVDQGISSYRAALDELVVTEVEVDTVSVRNVNEPSDLTRDG